jgi:hypothetical protein
MPDNSLIRFIAAVQSEWGTISTQLVQACRGELASLTLAEPVEPWLAALHSERPASRELHRDRERGFMLLAHTETRGLYRPPHDHGRAWVVYGLQSGALEIGTYAGVVDGAGRVQLVQRETSVLCPGEGRAYLPGDIHDTRCMSDTAMLFRFTERDLRHEDQVEHKLTRFVERNGEWTVPGA